MPEGWIIRHARQLAERSVSTGRPVLHVEVRALAFLAGGSRSAIDDAMLGVFAEAEAERRRADPAAAEA